MPAIALLHRSRPADLHHMESPWSRLAAPWMVCFEEAWAAFSAGSLAIGAVIADANGRVVARGRNAIFDDGAGALGGTRLAHAEMNALLELDGGRGSGLILYTTTEPCPLCVGATRMSGIKELHYASADPTAGSAQLFGANGFMRRARTDVYGPHDAALETVLQALYIASHCGRAGFAGSAEAMIDHNPIAARVAGALKASGELQLMRTRRWPAVAVYTHLARMAQETLPSRAAA